MSTENRLRIYPKLKEAYVHFINKYEKLGHMEQVGKNDEKDKPGYYIPHHTVLRDNSLTTKLRVVFDASCTTDTGKSLKNILLTRLRTHKCAMTVDICCTNLDRRIRPGLSTRIVEGEPKGRSKGIPT